MLLFFAAGARGEAIKGEIVSVGIGGINGANGIYRIGSWVPVQVRLQNMTPGPIECRLGVQSNELNDLDGDKVTSLGPVFTLTASTEPRTVWTYYWPGPDDTTTTGTRGIASVVIFDKSGSQILGEVTTHDRTANAVGLSQSDDGRDGTDRSTRFVVVLGKSLAGWSNFQRSWGGTEAVALAQVKNASQLPDDVKGFDAVDVIVWEADTVKPSEIPGEFQMKAMLQWVKAGGHLIISTGSQWQEFLKADAQVQAALPMTIKTSRTANWADVRLVASDWATMMRTDAATKDKSFDQVVGDLKPAAKAVVWPAGVPFAGSPLVVTGLYGQGAVTLVTLDVTNKDMDLVMREKDWAQFWTQAAGWIWPSDFLTATEYKKEIDNARGGGNFSPVYTNPGTLKLGETIPSDIDVKDFTFVRIFVAIIFLAIYWLLAGPIGHLILRAYHLVHWSWWVFGGTVLLAMAVAGGVVVMLHVSSSEVRHKTFVLGRVNSRDVSVASYYGIYAPASGAVELKQPPGDGMNYLVPMCFPINGDVKAYADPQGYKIWDDNAAAISPIFRNTLKKMQGRWTGEMAGVTGTAAFTDNPFHVLKGTLTNESDYDLIDVDIVAYNPIGPLPRFYTNNPGSCFLYRVGSWKKGATLDLAKATLDTINAKADISEQDFSARFGQLLEVFPHGGPMKMNYGGGGREWRADENVLFRSLQTQGTDTGSLLGVLTDARALDPLDANGRYEIVRGMGRLIDCTKELHATGALIIAHTDHATPVSAPVPLTLNNTPLPSKGEVEFVWALPVTGEMPVMKLSAEPVPALGPGAVGVPGKVEQELPQ